MKLGALIHRSLKVAEQVNRVAQKTYGTLALTSLGTKYNEKEIMWRLYRILFCWRFG